ncbi:hypothetical protein D3C76_943980 [compost metagenome]
MSAVLVLGLVAAFGGADLVDLDVFFPQVGIGYVDGHIVVRAPASTQAEYLTIASRNAWRAVVVVGRRLVDGKAGAQYPLLVDFVRRTNGMSPGVVPILVFLDGLECRTCKLRWDIVLHGDVFQTAPASPGATGVQGPLVIEFVGDREIDRFRCLDLQCRIELVTVERSDQRGADASFAFQLVVDHRVVGQAETGAVGGLDQDADVVTHGGIVTLDLYLSVLTTQERGGRQVRAQFALDAVDGRAKTDRDLVVEGVADGWLEGDYLDMALLAPVTCSVTIAVVGHQAKRYVDAEAYAPVVVDRFDVVTHGHTNERHHVAIGFPPKVATRARDVGLGDDSCATHGYLFALEARHAGRVAKHGAGIFGRRRTSRETCPHAADALLVQRETCGKQLAGSKSNGNAEGGFEHYFFHY